MIQRNCKICKSAFNTWPYSIKKGQGIYCSRECAEKGKWQNPTQKMLDHVKKAQAIMAKSRIGMKHSLKTRKLISKNTKRKNLGKDNPKFKGGYIDKWGYVRICINGKQVKRSRYVMEKYLKRKLKNWEDVHHINGNKLDDRIKNLIVLSKSNHTKLHFNINPIKFRQRYAK